MIYLFYFLLTINMHQYISINASKAEYLFPITWTCSCNPSVKHSGWMVKYEGKYYRVDGPRKDKKNVSPIYQSNSK